MNKMKTIKIDPRYNRKMKAANEKIYDEVTTWIGRISHHRRFDEKYHYYFIDEKENLVIRSYQEKRTIELSNLVNPETAKLIRHIIKTEIREPYL